MTVSRFATRTRKIPNNHRDYRPTSGYLPWLLTRCDRELARHLDRLLRRVDLTEAQYGVLQALVQMQHASSATLARAVGVTPQAMVGLIGALERKDFIVRRTLPGGGRMLDTEVTPAGRAAYESARRRIRGMDRALRSAMTDADHDRLTGLLERLPDVLRELRSEAPMSVTS